MTTYEIIYKGVGTLEIIRAESIERAYTELRLLLTMQGLTLTEQLDYSIERL